MSLRAPPPPCTHTHMHTHTHTHTRTRAHYSTTYLHLPKFSILTCCNIDTEESLSIVLICELNITTKHSLHCESEKPEQNFVPFEKDRWKKDKMTRQNKTRHNKRKKEKEEKEGREGGKRMSDRPLNFPDYGREECQF